jgi:hypothetical protein
MTIKTSTLINPTSTQEALLSPDGPEINVKIYIITILGTITAAALVIAALSCYYKYKIKHVSSVEARAREQRRARTYV